jgi:hypothetical protein
VKSAFDDQLVSLVQIQALGQEWLEPLLLKSFRIFIRGSQELLEVSVFLDLEAHGAVQQ